MGPALDVEACTDWVRAFAAAVHRERDALTDLDSAIGDADHGSNLDRGLTAALAALDEKPSPTPAALFKTVAMTLISKIGGASGPLYGTFFLRLSSTIGDDVSLTPETFAAGVRAGLDGVAARGKAVAGDKTMLDALIPAVDMLDSAIASGSLLGEALAAAAEAGEQGRDATIPLVARKGRASYLGERSAGHQDPGATSAALLIRAAAATLA